MSAYGCLIPKLLSPAKLAAGSVRVPIERPTPYPANTYRPAAPVAYSIMLDLLETLRSLALSGSEPAPFLIAMRPDGPPLMVANPAEPIAELARLRGQYGVISMAFSVGARETSAGMLLGVTELTGSTPYCLEQLCRRLPGGRCEALPAHWRHLN